MKKSNVGVIIVLLIVGCFFTFAGIMLARQDVKFQEQGISTQATITYIDRGDEDDSATVYVTYTVDEAIYTERLGFYASWMERGQMISILYMPDDPGDIAYPNEGYIPHILLSLGGSLCLCIAGAIVGIPLYNKAKLSRMKKMGEARYATVKELNYNPQGARIMEKYPATLVCVDSHGNVYRKKFLYSRWDLYEPGGRVLVYVDGINPDRYAVDLQSYRKKEE